MKYYIIVGEASGDLNGSNLMKSILEIDKDAQFQFFGGDLMSKISPKGIIKHYKELAFMGFWEVFINLVTILRNIKFCKRTIQEFVPDAVICIDYPGFNLRIVKWAKKQGFKTYYYISPQVWAWKENRVLAIKRSVDAMYVILPFEKDFYEQKHHFAVHFVGHPLLDAVDEEGAISGTDFFLENHLDERPIIALLPGSRKQEIKKMLSVMLSVVDLFPKYQFVIAGAPSQEFEFYKSLIKDVEVKFVLNQTYRLLKFSHAALVTSGTATLEAALHNVPEVVCYRGSYISYFIAKRVITLKYISLVNLILDKECVRELIQDNLNSKNLTTELSKLLSEERREKIKKDYKILREQLGGKGASQKTAKLIVESLKKA